MHVVHGRLLAPSREERPQLRLARCPSQEADWQGVFAQFSEQLPVEAEDYEAVAWCEGGVQPEGGHDLKQKKEVFLRAQEKRSSAD